MGGGGIINSLSSVQRIREKRKTMLLVHPTKFLYACMQLMKSNRAMNACSIAIDYTTAITGNQLTCQLSNWQLINLSIIMMSNLKLAGRMYKHVVI